MCIFGKLIPNRKYLPNKKNGGIAPEPKDKRVMAVPIGCGRCFECRKQEAKKWQLRMLEDLKTNKNGIMVTLTFSDESIAELTKALKTKTKYAQSKVGWTVGKDGELKTYEIRSAKRKVECNQDLKGYELDNGIAKIAIERFRERWRKEYKKSIRHWFVTELGHQGTENIHMHGIVWTDEHKREIEKHWKYGYVWTGDYCSERTVNYNIKYVHKQDQDHKEYKPVVLTSPGIGAGYTKTLSAELNKYVPGETREYYKYRDGHKGSLPTYWRNKIYSEEEREKLWLEKLDENVRWIDGFKIDISKNEDEYYALLEEARRKNKRLGYGDDMINWNQKKYEEERRILLHQKRIERAEKSLRGLGDAPESAESVNIFATLSWGKN